MPDAYALVLMVTAGHLDEAEAAFVTDEQAWSYAKLCPYPQL